MEETVTDRSSNGHAKSPRSSVQTSPRVEAEEPAKSPGHAWIWIVVGIVIISGLSIFFVVRHMQQAQAAATTTGAPGGKGGGAGKGFGGPVPVVASKARV